MYGAFAKLLNMSLTAGILVLAIILIRGLMKKAPRRYVCILWAVVAVRLVCPVSVESSFSVFNPGRESCGRGRGGLPVQRGKRAARDPH